MKKSVLVDCTWLWDNLDFWLIRASFTWWLLWIRLACQSQECSNAKHRSGGETGREWSGRTFSVKGTIFLFKIVKSFLHLLITALNSYLQRFLESSQQKKIHFAPNPRPAGGSNATNVVTPNLFWHMMRLVVGLCEGRRWGYDGPIAQARSPSDYGSGEDVCSLPLSALKPFGPFSHGPGHIHFSFVWIIVLDVGFNDVHVAGSVLIAVSPCLDTCLVECISVPCSLYLQF